MLNESLPMALPAVKKVVETALLVAPEPLSVRELKRLFSEPISSAVLKDILRQIQSDWADKGVELVELSTGWRFRARVEFQPYLSRLIERKSPRYSRAVMETLAIIAYRQPVTRGDIEAIRGVAVSSQVMQTLEARSWIERVGQKDVPGRPSLYATTRQFLDDLGLKSLRELPPLLSLEALPLTEELSHLVQPSPNLSPPQEE